MRSPLFLVAAMCVAEIFGMAAFATFPALLPTFQVEWGLSNTEAGWINAIYYFGYLTAVLILVSLTDRIDPKKIYLACMALTVAATGGFALLAEGFWSAVLLRSLAGIGLAGTYMPGLKLLSDLIEGPTQSRAVAFYTSSFGIGSSASYYFSGKSQLLVDWPTTFALAALGPAVALGLVWLLIPGAGAVRAGDAGGVTIGNFLRVLRNRRAMGYVLAYAVHNFELFALRSWMVAYLAFIVKRRPPGTLIFAPTTLAALVNLMGLPASVTGNELAARFGRPQLVSMVMSVSALVAFSLGLLAEMPGWVISAVFLLYGGLVVGESASVTAGAVGQAEPGFRGTTMAVHASIGFLGSFLGPLVFGIVLDFSGGGLVAESWGLAFTVMGLTVATGPFLVLFLSGGDPGEEA